MKGSIVLRCRPYFLRCLLITVSLALSGCSNSKEEAVNAGSEAQRPQEVTFNMGWLPQGSMAGVIVAIDRGFYREAGLEVDAVRGFGGIRTVNEIDQGMFEFGYGDPLAVILNRADGGQTRMVGAINNRWPAALCFVTSRHSIESPADLEGLTIGGGQTSPMQVIVPEWLELNGVSRKSVNVMQLDPSIVVNSLIEGQIDAGECWKGNSLAVFRKRAAEAGLEIGTIGYSDFGLDIYGNGIVTSERMIREKPDVVRAFLDATYRGYNWVRENPDEAVNIVTAEYPVLDERVTRQQIGELMELMSGPHPIGWLEKDKVAETLEFLANAYDVGTRIDVEDIYTIDFLPDASRKGGQ